MHRNMQHGTHVVLIKGSRRHRLGALADIDLDELIDIVTDCVIKYGNCGIELIEQVPGRGPIYKGNMHRPSFKARTRRKKGGIFHR